MTGLARLTDHFEVHEELDRGGFGVVYRGFANADGAEVAIKIPRENAGATELARVGREAALLAGIQHPKLVTFYGAFETDDGKVATVYERLYGRTLLEELGERLPGAGRAVRWCQDIAAGLDALHDAGLVHRDLKPANVWVLASGGMKLLDFGLLKPESAGGTLTETGLLIGTPEYMAPEQLEGARTSRLSDVYAFGCLAFRMIAGTAPYTGTPAEVVQGHMTGAIPPISQERPSVPVALDQVFARVLAKDPEARYATAREFAAAMEKIFESSDLREASGIHRLEDLRVPTVTLAPRASIPDGAAGTGAGRDPATVKKVAGGVAFALLVLVGVFAGSSPPAPDERPEPTRVARPDPAATWEHPALDPAFVAALRKDLTDAAGWGVDAGGEVVKEGGDRIVRELLDPDPLRWGSIARGVPSLARFGAWVRAGGAVESWPPELVAALGDAGERLAGQGLHDPFAPLLDLRPRDAPYAPPGTVLELSDARGLGPLDGEATGWRGTALEALEALVDQRRRRRADFLLARGEEAWPAAIPEAVAAGGPETFEGFLPHLFGSVEGREAGARWLAPAHHALARYLHAAGRLLREPGGDPDHAALFLAEALGPFHSFFLGALAVEDPEVLVAGTPVHPAGWLFAAAVVGGAERALGSLGSSLDAMRRTRFAFLEKAVGGELGSDAARRRAGAALEQWAKGLAAAGDLPGLSSLFARGGARLGEVDPAAQAAVAWTMAELLERSPGAKAAPGQVKWILKALSRHRSELAPEQQERLGEIARVLASRR